MNIDEWKSKLVAALQVLPKDSPVWKGVGEACLWFCEGGAPCEDGGMALALERLVDPAFKYDEPEPPHRGREFLE